jgi:hypothetical protein
MLQNAAIDVAIGLILMYLMLSLLCTVVNEFIATKLKLRSTTLQDALQKLIDDPTVLNNFYSHGLIASNFRASATGSQSTLEAVATKVPDAIKNLPSTVMSMMPGVPAAAAGAAAPVKEDHPSYLAGGTVALALLGSLIQQHQQQQPQAAQPQQPQPAQPLQQLPVVSAAFAAAEAAINNLNVAPKLKDALQAGLLQADGDIKKLQQGIATWFDDSMDRLSGAYKRKMKWIAMLIGLLVAIAFNADSFKVATTLWNDPDRRASTIEIATAIAKKPLTELPQSVDRAALDKAIANTETTLRSLPIGWNCPAPGPGKSFHYWTCAEDEFSKLTLFQFLGWILTAAALSLGAPFWFDLLNQFINLRGAGQKPVREDQK